MSRQLGLPFEHPRRFRVEEFLAAPCNEAALAWVARAEDWPQQRLALWGPEGCGKSHLLHVWAKSHGVIPLEGAMLSFAGPPDGPVAIDDADLAAPHDLLHVLNAAQEAGQPTLLAAQTAPARWTVTLPDLASRLRAAMAVEILPPDETLLRAMLAQLLARRQIAVAADVQDWLLLRLPRTQAAIHAAADLLDRASLARGGPVRRAIARDVLAEMMIQSNDEDFESASPPAPALL